MLLLYTNNNNYISGKDNHFGSMDSFGIVFSILKKSVTFHYTLVISAPINQLPIRKYPSKRKQKWKLVNDETFHGVLILMVILLCYIHAYTCAVLCYAMHTTRETQSCMPLIIHWGRGRILYHTCVKCINLL